MPMRRAPATAARNMSLGVTIAKATLHRDPGTAARNRINSCSLINGPRTGRSALENYLSIVFFFRGQTSPLIRLITAPKIHFLPS